MWFAILATNCPMQEPISVQALSSPNSTAVHRVLHVTTHHAEILPKLHCMVTHEMTHVVNSLGTVLLYRH